MKFFPARRLARRAQPPDQRIEIVGANADVVNRAAAFGARRLIVEMQPPLSDLREYVTCAAKFSVERWRRSR